MRGLAALASDVQARLPRAWVRRAARALASRFGLPECDLPELVPNAAPLADPITDDICMPPYGVPFDHDDYSGLMTIVKAADPRVVLEFGTAHGNTTANIRRECPDAAVYTLDVAGDDQSGRLTTFQLHRSEIGRVYRRHGLADRVVQIYGNSLHVDLSAHLEPGSVDVAIVDACHDAEFVLNDFAKVRPFVRRGGTVLFHDTHPSMGHHLAGSYIACCMLRWAGFDVRHLRDTWWAVWRKGGWRTLSPAAAA